MFYIWACMKWNYTTSVIVETFLLSSKARNSWIETSTSNLTRIRTYWTWAHLYSLALRVCVRVCRVGWRTAPISSSSGWPTTTTSTRPPCRCLGRKFHFLELRPEPLILHRPIKDSFVGDSLLDVVASSIIRMAGLTLCIGAFHQDSAR